jgi:MSHA biogenesis protein MshO
MHDRPRRRSRVARHRAAGGDGATLVELVVVIAITGIIAAAVASFIRRPVEGYVDAARRAELTDIADTALRRMTRDLRTALPNSIRVDGTGKYIEFLQTRGGGRYRAEPTDTATGDRLDFTAPDDKFDVIGPMPDFSGAGTKYIVIYNLTADPLIATANAYIGDNREAYASNDGSAITLAAQKQFPVASPGKRFQIVDYPVTYACEAGVLRRYWGYAIAPAQVAPPAGGTTALLATNVDNANCGFSYVTDSATGRTGVVALNLQITQGGESVRLFQQVHVSNVP